ncbi:MAG TPA: GxxExxY protein [Chitinophagales bacterium]|nr:GxxExxY protein [Chitinophagales bacterium]
MTRKYLNDLTFQIVGSAIEVHKAIGPGQLERIYHLCMIEELKHRGISFISEKPITITYKGKELSTDLRCDLLVENCVVVELKAVQEITPVYEAQVISYINQLQVPKGILINFNCINIFKEGQKTFVNKLFDNLPDG